MVPEKEKIPLLFWVILAIAFIIKITYLFISKESPFYEPLLLDPDYYHKWALKILAGDFIGEGVFYGLPLYPFFLALCYKLFDGSLFAVKLIQALLGLIAIFFIYKSAEKITEKKTALAASLLAAFYGPLFFHESILIPEALSVPLYAVSFYLACLLWDELSLKKGIIFGLLAGLAALTKAGIILFVIVFVIALSFKKFSSSAKKPIAITALLLAFFGVLLPVTLHNKIYGHDNVLLTSHAGFNFYIGNNPKAEGVFSAPEGTGGNVDAQIEDSKAVAERELGRDLKPSEISRYWSDKAWEFIRNNPGDFLGLCAKKFALFFDHRELADVDDYFFCRNFNPMLKLPWINFAFLGPLVFAGLFAGFGRLKYRMPILLWVGSYLFGIFSFFVNARYRLPMLGVFFILAGSALMGLYESAKENKWNKVFFYIIALGAGIGIGRLELVGTNWVRDYVNAGDIYQEKKDFSKALELYQKALEIDPKASKAALATALVYTKTGRHEDAKAYYMRALLTNPRDHTAFNNLGMEFDREGDPQKAMGFFLKAIEAKPTFAQAHNNLGMAYGKMGNNEKAIEEFDIAIKLNPNSARAYTNRGLVLHRLGQKEEAVRSWKKALSIDPEFPEAKRALAAFGN